MSVRNSDRASQAKANAVTKRTKEPKHRFEEFDATRPDGQVVHIRRNIDTGEQEVTEK